MHQDVFIAWFRYALTVALLGILATPAAAQTVPRWIDVQSANVAARYRFVQDEPHTRTTNDLQDQIAFRARLKADPKGRLSLNAGAFTGDAFASGWSNTGIGTGVRKQTLNVKQLFVAATPVTGVELQVGSLYVVRGESSEMTHYDNDGFVTGERLTIRRPRQLWLDEISVSHGFFGDLDRPSAFDRLHRLGDSNFRQLLVMKRVGAASVSVDWIDEAERDTWHGAIAVKLAPAVDVLRAELYARPDEDVQGAAISAERRLTSHLSIGGGYANVDPRIGPINGDRFGRGQRAYALLSSPLGGGVTVSAYYTHAFGNAFAVPIGQRFDAVVTYDLRAAFVTR